jgi:hypothetical protein
VSNFFNKMRVMPYSDAKEDEIFSVSLSNFVNFVILHTVNGYGAFM